MIGPIIKTLSSKVFGGGIVQMVWHPDATLKYQRKYSAAQRWLNSEIIRRSEPYTPLKTGMLIQSAEDRPPGSGSVRWTTPYARYQYYFPKEPGSATGPLRGPRWVDRMLADHKKTIIRGLKKEFGSK
jgi:hypothetical protein